MSTKNGKKVNGKRVRRENGTGSLLKKGNTWYALFRSRDDNGKLHQTLKSLKTGDQEEARELLDQMANEYETKKAISKDAEVRAKFTATMQRKTASAEDEIKRIAAEMEAARLAEEEKQPALSLLASFPVYLKSERRSDSGKRTLSDYEGYVGQLTDWMAEEYRVKEMRHVTPAMAEKYLQYLRSTRSASTRNKHLTFLKNYWRVLGKDARCSTNPWEEFKKLTEETHRRKELTTEELARILPPLVGESRLLFAIGIYTGLRLGDCCLLDWGAVDLVRGIIQTKPHKTARKYSRMVILPIHPQLRSMLLSIPESNRIGYVMPTIADEYLRNSSTISHRIQDHFRNCGIKTGSKGARLFIKRGTYRIQYDEIGEDGKHITENTGLADINEARKVFAEKVGTSERAKTDVGFHSLRHTFVSIMLNAGVSHTLVQAMVAHSGDMTMHYFHENREALAAAISKIPALFEDINADGATMPLLALNTSEAASTPFNDAEAIEGRFRAFCDSVRRMKPEERIKAAEWLNNFIKPETEEK